MLDFLLDLPVLLMALENAVPPLAPFPYVSKGGGKGPSGKGLKAAEGTPKSRVVLQLDSGGGGNGSQGLVMALLESAYLGSSSLTAAQQTADLEVQLNSANPPHDSSRRPPLSGSRSPARPSACPPAKLLPSVSKFAVQCRTARLWLESLQGAHVAALRGLLSVHRQGEIKRVKTRCISSGC